MQICDHFNNKKKGGEQKEYFRITISLEKYDKCSIKTEMSSLSFPVVLSVGVPRVSKQWEILHNICAVIPSQKEYRNFIFKSNYLESM